ncbi:MAG TPA: class I SAM-dependent methyltransferase [Candidatus Angelobacter sp.]
MDSHRLAGCSEISACPACGEELTFEDHDARCLSCEAVFPVDNGIPLLFASDEGQTRHVTDIVKAFYEENPFPNYDDLDSKQSLMEKARRGVFARLLDEQIPRGARVLEVGCGTGQLANFLGMHWDREVFGSDMCLNSLRLAKGFRDRSGIRNATFVQMNLFRPAFRAESFDIVISNGVLHHTSDPLGGFLAISRLVKPGGCILIGLYNKIGRLTTDLRRVLFRLSGNRLRMLDAHMRSPKYNEARKRAWFLDQYKHPRESKHSYDEVIDWFESTGFEFLFSIPKIDTSPFTEYEKLFEPHGKGTKLARLATQFEMLVTGGVDGALFITIGRKMKQGRGPSDPVERVQQVEAAPAPAPHSVIADL